MKYDMLSLGPARMDVFIKLPEKDVEEICSIDRKKCVIQLGFGEKIAVSGMQFAIGGNTGNNAVGLSRLGHKVAMIGTMSSGWLDQRALEVLKTEGVDTRHVCTEAKSDGFGVVLNYQEERTILSYYPQSNCDFPNDPDLESDWIYLTTAGSNYEQFYDQSLAWAIAHKSKIAFNPGTRQLHAGLEKLRSVMINTAILFLNREEAATLVNMDLANIQSLLKCLHDLGPKIVVITDGPAGTYCFDGQDYLHMPIIAAPVVERTGAGDAFGVGFIGATMQNKSVSESLQWGTVNSASVLGFIGPQAGLLTKEKLPSWLARAENVRVEKL